jgi:hypothetical protein
MDTQKVAVNYTDGTTKEVVLTQWAMSQWAVYCSRNGIHFDAKNPGLLALTMMRYQAWAEMHRAMGPNTIAPKYETWDFTVNSVDAIGEPEEVFPTKKEPQAD